MTDHTADGEYRNDEGPTEEVAPSIIDRGDIQRLLISLSLVVIVYSAIRSWTAGSPVSPEGGAASEIVTGFKVNVNQASVDELSLLPLVGPTLAQRIVAEREDGGPFRSVEDLGRTPGIGPERIARLSPMIRTSE